MSGTERNTPETLDDFRKIFGNKTVAQKNDPMVKEIVGNVDDRPDPSTIPYTKVINSNGFQRRKFYPPSKRGIQDDYINGRTQTPAYNTDELAVGSEGHHDYILEKSQQNKKKMFRKMRYAFPTYIIEFVLEEKKVFKIIEGNYGYNGVERVSVRRHKTMPSVAELTILNYSGILSEFSVGQDDLEETGSRTLDASAEQLDVQDALKQEQLDIQSNEYDSRDPLFQRFSKLMVTQGTRIVIRGGYGSNKEDLEIIFTGQIDEVNGNDVLHIVAQGYGKELTKQLQFYEDGNEAQTFEVLSKMLDESPTEHFGRFDLDEASKETKTGQQVSRSTLGLMFGLWSRFENFFDTRKNDNIYVAKDVRWLQWAGSRQWVVPNITGIEVGLEMARHRPGFISYFLPYDNGATYFFGKPEQEYYFTGSEDSKMAEDKWRQQVSTSKKNVDLKVQQLFDKFITDTNIYEQRKGKYVLDGYPLGHHGVMDNQTAIGGFIQYRKLIKKESFEDVTYGGSLGVGAPNYPVRKHTPSVNAPSNRLVDEVILDDTWKVLQGFIDNYGERTAQELLEKVIEKFVFNRKVFRETLKSEAIGINGWEYDIVEEFVFNSADVREKLFTRKQVLQTTEVIASTAGPASYTRQLDTPRWTTVRVPIKNKMQATVDFLSSSYVRLIDWRFRFRELMKPLGSSDNKRTPLEIIETVFNGNGLFSQVETLEGQNRFPGIPLLLAGGGFNGTRALDKNDEYVYLNEGDAGTGFDFLSRNSVNLFNYMLRTRLFEMRFAIKEFIEWIKTDRADRSIVAELQERGRALKKLGSNPRKKVFRQYHTVDSYSDIIKNEIVCTKSEMYNEVLVRYPDGDLDEDLADPRTIVQDSGEWEQWTQVVDDSIPKGERKIRVVVEPNAEDIILAKNVANSNLAESLRPMYRGALVIRGREEIKPYDIIYIYDFYNKIFGPVEVEAVTHHFSHEEGFVSVIEPHLFVTCSAHGTWRQANSEAVNSILTIGLVVLGTAAVIATGGALLPVMGAMATTMFAAGGAAAAYQVGVGWHDLNNTEDNSFYKVISGRGRTANNMNPVDIVPLQYKGEPWVASLYGAFDENFVSLISGKVNDLKLGWKLLNAKGSTYKSEYIRYFTKLAGGDK